MRKVQSSLLAFSLVTGILATLGLAACGVDRSSPIALSPTDQSSEALEGVSGSVGLVSQARLMLDGAPELRYVPPSATSRDIPDQVPTPDGDLYNPGDHLAGAPSHSATQGKLVLFFPGTGGQPRQYSLFAQYAADQGFHIINLAYENASSINFQICRDDVNPDCHRQARTEILTGADTSADLTVEQRPASAAFSRLANLLLYLHQTYPQEAWDQYLDAQTNQLQWSQIIMAGHSQGGGMAAFSGTLQSLSRVILFNATEPAQWTLDGAQTPSNAYYGIAHKRETSYRAIVQSWENLNLPGWLINVDRSRPPYWGSHRLVTTNRTCPLPDGVERRNARFHNCVIVDDFIPLTNDGQPQVTDVWSYLLGVER